MFPSAYIVAMAHVHHSHQGADLVEAAKSTMERSGEQWTQMRAAVFDALATQWTRQSPDRPMASRSTFPCLLRLGNTDNSLCGNPYRPSRF